MNRNGQLIILQLIFTLCILFTAESSSITIATDNNNENLLQSVNAGFVEYVDEPHNNKGFFNFGQEKNIRVHSMTNYHYYVVLPQASHKDKDITWEKSNFKCETSYTSHLNDKELDLVQLSATPVKVCGDNIVPTKDLNLNNHPNHYNHYNHSSNTNLSSASNTIEFINQEYSHEYDDISMYHHIISDKYLTSQFVHDNIEDDTKCVFVIRGSYRIRADKTHKKQALGFMCEFSLPNGTILGKNFLASAWLREKKDETIQTVPIDSYKQIIHNFGDKQLINVHTSDYDEVVKNKKDPLKVTIQNVSVNDDHEIEMLAIDMFNIYMFEKREESAPQHCNLTIKRDDGSQFKSPLPYEILHEEGAGKDINHTIYITIPKQDNRVIQSGDNLVLICPTLYTYLKNSENPLVWVLFPQYVSILGLVEGTRQETAKIIYGEWIALGLGYNPWPLIIVLAVSIILFGIIVIYIRNKYSVSRKRKVQNTGHYHSLNDIHDNHQPRSIPRSSLLNNTGTYEDISSRHNN